jgi:hypothetical protein
MLPIPVYSLRTLLLLLLLSASLDTQNLRDKADMVGVSIGTAVRPRCFRSACIP